MKARLPRLQVLLLAAMTSVALPRAAAAEENHPAAEERRHCLSASPLKPFFGLVLVDYDYTPSRRWSLSGSVDYLWSPFLLSRTLGALYGDGFEHPSLVVRAGPRFWLDDEGGPSPAGPCLGATAGYVRGPVSWRPVHALSLGAEAGWRFPFANHRAMAMPRLQASVATSAWKPVVGAELLLGVHF